MNAAQAGVGPAPAQAGAGAAVDTSSAASPASSFAPTSDVFRALLARLQASDLTALESETDGVSACPSARKAALGESAQRRVQRGFGDDDDPTDPLRRHRAALQAVELVAPYGSAAPALSPSPAPPISTAERAQAAVSLEQLLPALVRRIAWSGDGKRGTARLEIGAGELAGATLLVSADAGRVGVYLDVPPGVDPSVWQARIRRRLQSRSIVADCVEVT